MRVIRVASAGFALACVAVLGACGTGENPGINATPSGAPTPTAGTVFDKTIDPAVTALRFTNQDGQSVTLDSLKGQTVVLTDFLTLCQEICPLTTANYLQIAAKVKAAGATNAITLLEITVDPARDTAARLKAYQARLGAEPNWAFWTGSVADITKLWAAMGISYEKVMSEPGSKPIDWMTGKVLTYDVTHQDVLFVLGVDGHEKWLIQGNPNLSGFQIPGFLSKFLNDAGKSNLTSPGDQSWTAADVEMALSYVSGSKIG